LVSQVLLYPGVEDIVVTLGGDATVDAGMWFLVAEFAAFVAFASVWGAASDALGRRATSPSPRRPDSDCPSRGSS
jgi:hypothetical protein